MSNVVPSYIGYTEKAKKVVCNLNCNQVEKEFEIYLEANSVDNNTLSILFTKFINEFGQEICPQGSEINYQNGDVRCELHITELDDGEKDNDNEEVPYL